MGVPRSRRMGSTTLRERATSGIWCLWAACLVACVMPFPVSRVPCPGVPMRSAGRAQQDVLARTSVVDGRVLLTLGDGADNDVTVDGDLDLSCPPATPPPVLGAVDGTYATTGADTRTFRHSATQQMHDGCWGDALRGMSKASPGEAENGAEPPLDLPPVPTDLPPQLTNPHTWV
eukprot:m.1260508 g.1260508  ORF g.1260508 m.1260508 type:complete len:175 (+) comp24727_c0_seq12:1967-2491(+)